MMHANEIDDLPDLDGVSLNYALQAFVDAKFSSIDDETGCRIHDPDAVRALKYIDQNYGSIVRLPELMFAGDDLDLFANRLLSDGRLSFDAARSEMLVFQPFFDAFRRGEWVMVGSEDTLAGAPRCIEWRTIQRMCAIRFSASEAQELPQGGIRFVNIRVFSRDRIASLIGGHQNSPARDARGEPIEQVASKISVEARIAKLDLSSKAATSLELIVDLGKESLLTGGEVTKEFVNSMMMFYKQKNPGLTFTVTPKTVRDAIATYRAAYLQKGERIGGGPDVEQGN